MNNLCFRRAGLLSRSRRHQQGQALIYGLFVLFGGLAALFFLFNTGQLSSEKTKLVNTADAVAYSAGVMHARALNFDAYSNRALIANEVLVAQMVSLSSWAQYAKTHAENLVEVFPECADPYGYGAAAGAAFNYGPLYAAMCYLTVQYAGEYIAAIAERVPPVTRTIVFAVEGNKAAIQAAQALLHSPLFEQARGSLMQEVAQRNYAGDGTVSVEPIGVIADGSSAMTDD
jgi:ureidoglycolate hydrolase